MEIGDSIIIKDEKWVAVIDKSTKKTKMFELWNPVNGHRMAYVEINHGK